MTEARSGGRRRLDRVLAPDFLDDLRTIPLGELRRRRGDAEQEEVDLSYLRRLLQGRLDIVAAETARRRDGGDGGSVLARLAEILVGGRPDEGEPGAPGGAGGDRGAGRAEGPGGHGGGRHQVLEPTRAQRQRRRVESLVGDAELSDVGRSSDGQLAHWGELLEAEEHRASETRAAVQQVMDRCSAEIGRRYRDGEATVSDVLTGEQR